MTMTIKKLHMDAKRNMTTEEVLQKYGIATTTEFYKIVEKLSSQKKASEFKKYFDRNDKIARKVGSGEDMHFAKDEMAQTMLPAEAEMTVEDVSAKAQDTENGQENISIDSLKEQESVLSGEVIDLEKRHKKLAEARFSIRKEVAGLDNVLKELSRLVAENLQKLEDFEKQYDEIAAEMAQVSSEIATKRAQLVNIRGQIEELERVTIFVYENGDCDIENGELNPDEALAKQIFEELLSKPEADEVTIKVVRTISKIKAMGGETTVVFESEKARILFEAE